MTTEVWFRNPHNYARELAEVGYGLVAWDRGMLAKRRVDPIAWSDLFLGLVPQRRTLIIGEQGSAEVDEEHSLEEPKAVYPTWMFGEEQSLLQELVEQPVGEDEEMCNDPDTPLEIRPVFGQEHRIIISDLPQARSIGGKPFYTFLKQIQEDNPNCIIHVHGSYSFRMMFALGYGAADVDPRTAAQKGSLLLPSGQIVPWEQGAANPKWMAAMGFLPVDMSVPRNRCMYNIKSALWCGEHYTELHSFGLVNNKKSEGATKKPRPLRKNAKPINGDMVTCNDCSLAKDCKYERADSICSVPGAEVSELSKYFKTRDSASILDGLGELMSRNADRLEAGIEQEEVLGELDSEVTKIMGQLYDQGVKLAKLVDPVLRSPQVAVNVLNKGGAQAVQMGNPRELIAGAMRELERQGIPRDKITTEMLEGLLTGMTNQGAASRAIEGTVID